MQQLVASICEPTRRVGPGEPRQGPCREPERPRAPEDGTPLDRQGRPSRDALHRRPGRVEVELRPERRLARDAPPEERPGALPCDRRASGGRSDFGAHLIDGTVHRRGPLESQIGAAANRVTTPHHGAVSQDVAPAVEDRLARAGDDTTVLEPQRCERGDRAVADGDSAVVADPVDRPRAAGRARHDGSRSAGDRERPRVAHHDPPPDSERPRAEHHGPEDDDLTGVVGAELRDALDVGARDGELGALADDLPTVHVAVLQDEPAPASPAPVPEQVGALEEPEHGIGSKGDLRRLGAPRRVRVDHRTLRVDRHRGEPRRRRENVIAPVEGEAATDHPTSVMQAQVRQRQVSRAEDPPDGPDLHHLRAAAADHPRTVPLPFSVAQLSKTAPGKSRSSPTCPAVSSVHQSPNGGMVTSTAP